LKYSFTRFVTVGKNSGSVEANFSCDVFIVLSKLWQVQKVKVTQVWASNKR
jgi:hypothetical protein